MLRIHFVQRWYLTAVVDWYSWHVLARRASLALDTAFCVEAGEEA